MEQQLRKDLQEAQSLFTVNEYNADVLRRVNLFLGTKDAR